MAQQTVNVTIKKDGTISFETLGFVGAGCDVIKDIENAVGIIQSTEPTAEAYLYENPDINYLNV